jgi:uncharacterized protein (DUF3820 family)
MTGSLQKKSRWVDVSHPAGEMSRMLGHMDPTVRRLEDMPEHVPEGAKAVALLTIWVREQKFAFEPIMESLRVLASLQDWSEEFLVADGKLTDGFNWKKQPFKKYASFQDFYTRELEETWGAWNKLQETYAQCAEGKITEQEALAGYGGDRRSQEAKADNQAGNTILKRGQTMKMPFGKHQGQEIATLPGGYLRWLATAEFIREPLKSVAKAALGTREESKGTNGNPEKQQPPKTAQPKMTPDPKLLYEIIDAGQSTLLSQATSGERKLAINAAAESLRDKVGVR